MLLESVNAIIQSLETTLNEAIDDSKNDFNLFIESKIFKLGRFIGQYYELLKSLDVEVNDDLKDALESIDDTNTISKRLDKFLIEWNHFLDEIEFKYDDSMKSKSALSCSQIEVNQLISNEIITNNEYFIKLSYDNNYEKPTSLQSICEQSKKKYAILVMLRHFA